MRREGDRHGMAARAILPVDLDDPVSIRDRRLTLGLSTQFHRQSLDNPVLPNSAATSRSPGFSRLTDT